jgi:hypothetical protein
MVVCQENLTSVGTIKWQEIKDLCLVAVLIPKSFSQICTSVGWLAGLLASDCSN